MCPRCDEKCDYFALYETCGYSRVRVDIPGYAWFITVIAIVTSARRLCNHLGLYVRMCVCVYVCMCVCVFVCEHDNSKNNKHLDVKFCTHICHCLRKN